jgi:hypothetical protein
MFVIKGSTISAVLFTLVVTFSDKTVAAKHVRQATAYDSAATGMVLHPAHFVPDGKEADRLLQSSAITSCDVPGEGPIIANWNGGSCYGSVTYCCGPIPVYALPRVVRVITHTLKTGRMVFVPPLMHRTVAWTM